MHAARRLLFGAVRAGQQVRSAADPQPDHLCRSLEEIRPPEGVHLIDPSRVGCPRMCRTVDRRVCALPSPGAVTGQRDSAGSGRPRRCDPVPRVTLVVAVACWARGEQRPATGGAVTVGVFGWSAVCSSPTIPSICMLYSPLLGYSEFRQGFTLSRPVCTSSVQVGRRYIRSAADARFI